MSAGPRVAVVGVGNRAHLGQQVPEAWPGAAVVAAVDPDHHGRARARSLFGAGTAVHADVAALVAAGGVDAALVTTPDDTHARLAIQLLRAGVAVLVDKPLATTTADADAVLVAARETGTPLYVGHNLRHWEVVRVMHDAIARGEIGEVRAVWVRHFVGNGGDYFFKDWHADRRRSGSLLTQKASHDIDVVHHLAGAYTSRVVGMGDLMVYGDITDRRERPGEIAPDWTSHAHWPPRALTGLNPVVDVEDLSMLMMRLENGVLASYQQCHFTPDYWRSYTVIGTEGRLENAGDTGGAVVRVWNRRLGWSPTGHVEHPVRDIAGGHRAADTAMLTEFFAHVLHGAPTAGSPVDARQAVAVGSLGAESLRHGCVPLDVPPLPAGTAPPRRAARHRPRDSADD
ncbi:Gfo/Idh/MocA family protein [Cellulomonas pakistanensis]|uniref:Oxidoreductase n=1 Tax=Cellulomonas pakistanensis TaxID=992287 RepID=A0A919U5N8_9CELL|nr:Gfo/Idh/MocA family oxidoreductase [Cellulomonas pakistanensis]GIG36234.1 oxidoreductase [Cellulomonas pakistanensis]